MDRLLIRLNYAIVSIADDGTGTKFAVLWVMLYLVTLLHKLLHHHVELVIILIVDKRLVRLSNIFPLSVRSKIVCQEYVTV